MYREIRVVALPHTKSKAHSKNNMATQYIRPSIRVRGVGPAQFVSHTGPGGATYSQWKNDTPPQLIASGTCGRAGEISDLLNKGIGSVRFKAPSEWRPPQQYEWYAQKLGLGPEFVKRCEDWHAKHQTTEQARAEELVIDPEPILKMLKKYSKKGKPTDSGMHAPARPPLDRMVVAWECAGYTPDVIAKAVDRQNLAEKQMDLRQKAINDIFGNYASTSKPAPKNKKKIIKAVKKKMVSSNNV